MRFTSTILTGIVAGTKPDFNTILWPFSLATKAINPLASPLRGFPANHGNVAGQGILPQGNIRLKRLKILTPFGKTYHFGNAKKLIRGSIIAIADPGNVDDAKRIRCFGHILDNGRVAVYSKTIRWQRGEGDERVAQESDHPGVRLVEHHIDRLRRRVFAHLIPGFNFTFQNAD